MEEAPIWKGSQSTIKIRRETPTVVTVPSGSSGKVTTQIVRTDPLMAPISKGQQVGVLKVLVADQVAAELPIFAQESVTGMRSACGFAKQSGESSGQAKAFKVPAV